MSASNVLAIDSEAMKVFGFWGGILALKLFAMVVLTARYRFQKKVFINPEDAAGIKGAKITNADPDVERVRRAHLNDLENIPIWYIVTLLWLTTGPSTWLAGILIKSFVIARIVHTLVYAVYPMQPYRALAFFVGLGITIYQAISTMLYYS
ncbi:PREDICTED: microsomal glutathione S-transferase 1-like [Dufourea novaeangliae]|uniref:Microsomal glutathione S-transferase 1 n=1 Tax=Dufourea novaeangliae TaxID=178035 RepID=A0A154NXK9_DUFNO|nr:PREDICTED: microsomal glutathione S-transferase 1-like [Dufourea novaeangliae]KZC04399.1 Microsomal glutathione S-transferase 1 [Dufourea novaeangliae]